MATLTQDEHYSAAEGSGVTVRFFDSHTPPRAAKIDVSDRQPSVVSSDVTVMANPTNIVVAADSMSLTFDAESVVPGVCHFVVSADVNLASGQDTDLTQSLEDVTVTPGAAGQAASAQGSFPAATPKPAA